MSGTSAGAPDAWGPPSLRVIVHHSVVQPKHLCTVTESQEEESGGFKASQRHGSEVPESHFHSILLAKASHKASPDPRGEESHFLMEGVAGMRGIIGSRIWKHSTIIHPLATSVHTYTPTHRHAKDTYFLPPKLSFCIALALRSRIW